VIFLFDFLFDISLINQVTAARLRDAAHASISQEPDLGNIWRSGRGLFSLVLTGLMRLGMI
jgi:hypothetical protein